MAEYTLTGTSGNISDGSVQSNMIKLTIDTIPPTVNNDITQSYAVGSRWIDTKAKEVYNLVDNTKGAAVWVTSLKMSVYDTNGNNIVDKAENVDDGTNSSTAADVKSAVTLKHNQQHAVNSTADHTSAITSDKMIKADANGLPAEATNTDAQVADAVTRAHTQNTDTGTTATDFYIDTTGVNLPAAKNDLSNVADTTVLNKVKAVDGLGSGLDADTVRAKIPNISVNTTPDLLAVDTAKFQSVSLLGYHTQGDGGGGVFYWDANESKSNHNGGTVIDPTVAFPTDWTNQTQLDAWFPREWQTDFDWVAGDLVLPTTANNCRYVNTVAGKSGANEPVWNTTDASITIDNNSPAWAASTSKAVNNMILATTDNGYNYECTTAGTSGVTEPTWPTTVGATVDDDAGAIIWASAINKALDDLDLPTTANGYYYKCTTAGITGTTEPTWPTTEGATVTDNAGIPAWAASTSYAVGDIVIPSTANGYTYECTTAGTSDSSEPTWGTTVGGTTTDNTVTWTCRAQAVWTTYKIATWTCRAQPQWKAVNQTGCWKRVYDGEVYVDWFGAKGDGITDDIKAIQKALDFLPASQYKRIKIQGNYTVNKSINIPSYTILNLFNAVFTFSANINPFLNVTGDYVTIKGGLIDGAHYTGSAVGIYGSHIDVTNMEIKNIDQTDSVYVYKQSYIRFLNNYIHDGGANATAGTCAGIDCSMACSDILIQGNKIENIYGNCVTIFGDPADATSDNYRIQVIGNILGPTTRLDGVQFYYRVHDSVIANNIIREWDRNAIKLDNAQNCVVDSNECYNSKSGTKDGIQINTRRSDGPQAAYNIVSNNIISLPNAETTHSISIESDALTSAPYNSIVGNACYNNNCSIDQGMIGFSYAPYTLVEGNYLYEPRAHGIRLALSPHSKIISNYIYESGWSSNVGHGIYLADGGTYNQFFCTVENNTIDNPGVGQTTPASDGIAINGGYVTIRGNYIFDWNNPTKMLYAIDEMIAANQNVIEHNTIQHRTTQALINVNTNPILRDNPGYLTENSGSNVQSGDGTTVAFSIAHGLISTPTFVNVQPGSADADGDFYVTVDATNITITYGTAPASGTNNLTWYWEAKK